MVDLGRILLKMDVVYANELWPLWRLYRHAAANAQRTAVFAYLVVLGHVWIEVVLAVERGVWIDLATKHHAAHDR